MRPRNNTNSDLNQKIKIVILGDKSVGKSSIIHRFVHNQFLNNPQATIGVDYLSKNIKYERKKYRVQFWDTAGQQKYRSLVRGYLRNVDACIFVYDCSQPKTYENLLHWIKLINQTSHKKIHKVIVGNKIDLVQKYDNLDLLKKNMKSINQQMKEISQHQISAKQNININQVFQEIIHKYSITAQNNNYDNSEYFSFERFGSNKKIQCCK